jgi:hypothetical protein
MQHPDLFPGTLDTAEVPARGPLRGDAPAERARQQSQEVLSVGAGSRYAARYRLQDAGWVSWERGQSEKNRRAKHCPLIQAGRSHLEAGAGGWARMTKGMERIMPAG